MLTAHHIPIVILRGLSVLAAMAFFYMALFMYADDAGKWQNRLVDLWVEIGSGSQGFLSAQAALVKKSSGLVTSWLSWLLGERLFSAQVVAVSLSLSFASTMAFYSSFGIVGLMEWESSVEPRYAIATALAIGFFAFGVYGVRGLCRRFTPLLALVITVVLVALASPVGLYLYSPQEASEQGGLASLALVGLQFMIASVFGVVCDLLVLVVNRLVLRSMAATGRTSVLLLGFLYNLAWVAVLADAAVLLFRVSVGLVATNWGGDPVQGFLNLPFFQSSAGIKYLFDVELCFTSDLFTLCVSAGVFAIVAAALSHRLIWPVVERSVYALYQWKVFTNKPLQISAGLALLVFAFPGIRTVFALFKP